MKVAELKEELRKRGLSVSGNKAELIKRLKSSSKSGSKSGSKSRVASPRSKVPTTKPISKPISKPKSYKVKEIEYDWGGGEETRLVKPGVEMTWISPKNSEGVYNQDLSYCNLEGADITGSWFIKCDFRNSNLKDVKFRGNTFPLGGLKNAGVYWENFEGSVFTNAHNIDPKLLEVIKKTGGILTEKHSIEQKNNVKKARVLMKKLISSEHKSKELKKEILLLLNNDYILYNSIRRGDSGKLILE